MMEEAKYISNRESHSHCQNCKCKGTENYKLCWKVCLSLIGLTCLVSVLISLYITTDYIGRHYGEHQGDEVEGSLDLKQRRELSVKTQQDDDEQRIKYHTMVADQLFAENIMKNLEYIACEEHLAGTEESKERAYWFMHKLKSYGFDNVVDKKYTPLLSYPVGPGNITVFDKNGTELGKITITESNLDDFEKNAKAVLPPFLAFSKPGVVEGELVYANYGSEDDFLTLKKVGVDVKDKVVLIRYGRLSRNKKIKYAEQYNVKGVILFSDPENYSPTGVFYPNSWYLPPDAVQRGTLLRMRGDPLTRGFPAIDGIYSRPVSEVEYFPKVPVQPIGFGPAEKLLGYLDGKSAPNDKWNGKLNITYNITSKDHRQVKLHVNVTKEKRQIVDVVGIIRGAVEPDRTVIVGNHRDSWGYGAADPSSGTAVQVEIARALGWLKQQGWQPRRTIMFGSWDGEEYGLLGSTEWVEEHAKILSAQAVAYVNLDTAVQGNHTMLLKSTPELRDTFFDAARRFRDPDNQTNLYDVWIEKNKQDKIDVNNEPDAQLFREGSDYMPFYGSLGIPALDLRYTFSTKQQGVFNYPVYHTKHDNIEWVRRFIDPDMRYHVTLAKVMTQVILQLSDSVLLPFNLMRYVDSIRSRVRKLEKDLKKKKLWDKFDISLLKKSTATLHKAGREFHENLKNIDKTDHLAVRIVNDQMMLFERTWVTSEDIPDEPNTRHVFHTGGLDKAMQAVINGMANAEVEFKKKLSTYTYHVMMAGHALKNPFITKGEVKSTDFDENEKKMKKKQEKIQKKKAEKQALKEEKKTSSFSESLKNIKTERGVL